MDEKEAEARPVMGTILLVKELLSKETAHRATVYPFFFALEIRRDRWPLWVFVAEGAESNLQISRKVRQCLYHALLKLYLHIVWSILPIAVFL